MTPREPIWAQNNRQIARALGLKPTTRQFATIGDWRKHPDFPRKHPQGYRIAELLKWRAARLDGEEGESREQRAESRKQKAENRNPKPGTPTQPPLPEQEQPAEGELFADAGGFNASLDLWEDKLKHPEKWEHSPIQQWQVRQLQQHRPALFKLPTTGDGSSAASGPVIFPEFIDGMDNLGALIMQRFSEYPALGEVGRQRIQNWKKGVGIVRRPGLATFPTPKGSNRYHVQTVFDWVQKWIISDLVKPNGELVSGLSARDEMAKIELRAAQRSEQYALGNLVKFSDVRGFVQAAPMRLANYFNRIEERAGFQKQVVDELAAMLGAGTFNIQHSTFNIQSGTEPAAGGGTTDLPAILAAFADRLAQRCQQFNDGLKAEAEHARRQAAEELEKLRAQQVALENGE